MSFREEEKVYRISDLLEARKFSSMQLLCGEKGKGREIKGIRIIEVEDMDRFLSGGEILITSLHVYSKCTDSQFENYLKALIFKKEISGFIIKKKQNLNKDHFEILRSYCEKYDLPLIEMPVDMYYWEVIRDVMERIYDKETARLKYFKITHDNFNSLVLDDHTTDSKSKGIIDFLETMIENPIAIYHGNGNPYISTKLDKSKLILMDNLEEYKPNIITKFKYMRQRIQDIYQYIIKVNILKEIDSYIVITEENRSLSELDYMAIENAIITLQYSFITKFAQNEVRKKYKRDVVHNIIHGLLNYEETIEAARVLGLREKDQYRVVDFHTIPKNKEGKYTKEQLREVEMIEGELITLLPEEHIYRNMNQIVMIQKVDSRQKDLDYDAQMTEIQQVVQKNIMERKKNIDFQIGIGSIVTGCHNLKTSYEQAKKAVACTEIVRWISRDETVSVVRYSKMGFFQLFLENDNTNTLLQYVPETLKKLKAYEDKHHGDLLLTLAIYLENNMNRKKTAEDLNIHYRSVSYRIDKIKEITGINFDNGVEMLAIRNGLLIYKLNQKLK